MTTVHENGLNFLINEEENTATVVASPEAIDAVIIPKEIMHDTKIYPVVSIGEKAFNNNRGIRTLSFELGTKIRTIQRNSFMNSNIEKITVPPTLAYLAPGCFHGATKLTDIVISPKNKYLVYQDNKYLIRIKGAQRNKNNLVFVRADIEEAVVPADVIRIEENAFSNCSSLKSIKFAPNSILRSIERDAFKGCSVTSIDFPAKLSNLEDGWNDGISQITNMTVAPESNHLKVIDNTYLIQLGRIPDNDILEIARRDLQNATIPGNIVIIDHYAFDCCQSLKTVSFAPSEKTGAPILSKIGYHAFYNCLNLTRIAPFPATLTGICDSSFDRCNNLEEISFVQSPTPVFENLGERAFTNCVNLTTVKGVPSSLKQVGFECFKFDRKLMYVELLSENIRIGENSFEYCPSLKQFTIPSAKTVNVGVDAFRDCPQDFAIQTPEGASVIYETNAKPETGKKLTMFERFKASMRRLTHPDKDDVKTQPPDPTPIEQKEEVPVETAPKKKEGDMEKEKVLHGQEHNAPSTEVKA